MKPKILLDASELAILAAHGIHTTARAYAQDGWKADIGLAMDAQPTLITSPNAGIPAYLANLLDPEVVRVLTARSSSSLRVKVRDLQSSGWYDAKLLVKVCYLTTV